jgi:putative transposase
MTSRTSYEKAKQNKVVIEVLETMPDHVHLFVSAEPTEAPQRIANPFKGDTSRILRQACLEKLSSLGDRVVTLTPR